MPYLKGGEISSLMHGYCGYIENSFDLLQIGEKSEWFHHKVESPLEGIVRSAFEEGRVGEDVACLFLVGDFKY